MAALIEAINVKRKMFSSSRTLHFIAWTRKCRLRQPVVHRHWFG